MSDSGRIQIQCPNCEQGLRLPAHRAGTVKCPRCGKTFAADTQNKVRIGELYFALLDDIAQYFKFAADGTVISVMSDGTPGDVCGWFTQDHHSVSAGRFTVAGETIEIWLQGRASVAHYAGRIEPYGLELYIEIRGEKEHVPAFLAEGVAGPNHARPAEATRIRSLIEDLVASGLKNVPDRGSSSHFLSEARAQAQEIGAKLNELGGLSLMQAVHSEIQLRLGPTPARELEAAWGGIGEWLS